MDVDALCPSASLRALKGLRLTRSLPPGEARDIIAERWEEFAEQKAGRIAAREETADAEE